jgi:acyl-CoA thioesterase II
MTQPESPEIDGQRRDGPEPASGAAALQELVDLLELREGAHDTFTGDSCSRSLPFVFGGQVAAQSLAAAYRTVPEWARVHSLHGYFISAGDPDQPLFLTVSRIRDGRSFIARQVVVTQEHGPVFTASMSFAEDETGLEHADSPGPAIHLNPEGLPHRSQRLGPHRDELPDWWSGPMAMDVRFVDEPPHVVNEMRQPRQYQQVWMRSEGALDDDPRVHECIFAFASDLTLLDPVVLAHGRSWYAGDLKAASLDHSIWFHRRFRIDDWLLYEQRTPAAFGGRGLALGSVFTRDGQLTSSVAQEGLIRLLGS